MNGENMVSLIQIPVGGKTFDGWLYTFSEKSLPGIVMIPEIFGVNQGLREMAERYAREGFAVLAVDIFWRMQRHVNLGYTKEDFAQAKSFHERFDYETGVADMQAAISTLRARPECSGKVGVVGFCLGGTMGYLAGSRTDADAAVGYYGTRIDSFLDDGARISRPTMLHLGRLDHRTPPPVMEKIISAVKNNQHAIVYPYDDAVHAFANHHRPETYNAQITKTADERTFSLFRSKLQQA